MILTEVKTLQQIKEFIEFPTFHYANDKNYIRPLDEDVSKVFDADKNKLLKDDNCKRWLLKNEVGGVLGRLAAFINPMTANLEEQPTGGIGFFDCINNREAAFLLFDVARQWLQEQGMQAMDGPVNLGSRERWWGVLADGFFEPGYCCNYNFPYYQDLFEAYGFQLYFKQFTYIRAVHSPMPKALIVVAERVMRNGDYSFRHFEKSKIDKYAEDFRLIYNKAWVNHEGVGEMGKVEACKLVNSLKPVIDERIIWFAYYKDEPIGFFISIPELNQLFVKYVDGKLDSFGKLRLLFNKWTGATRSMSGLAFGIVPGFQRKGVEIALIVAAAKAIKDKVPYKDIEMNWIGDFNPRMMHVAEQIGAKIYKTHHTYRYLFDRSKEFRRHPEI